MADRTPDTSGTPADVDASSEGAFVNLHTHTEYSLLDGACRVEDVVRRAASLGQPALALTDHGVLYGAVEFYRAAREAGITPILGMEAYIAHADRFQHDATERSPYHLVLLAADAQGWRNLVKLSSRGHTEGFYQRPRIDKELMGQCSSGLICLSGCLGGELAHTVLGAGVDAAERVAREHAEIFGHHRYFLEIQNHGDGKQHQVNQAILTIARRTGLELVATNDAHYVHADDADMHEVLLAMGTGARWSDRNRHRFPGSGYHLASAVEMRGRFAFAPSAVTNTVAIARMVSLELSLDEPVVPPFHALAGGTTAEVHLRELCQAGLLQRYGRPLPEVVQERMNRELAVIHGHGFESYFLTVHDYVSEARRQGIRVGPGRGSAAGSIVSYSLGITNLDPLKHGLLFERFLNSERRSLPDIDVDFDDRDAVIALLRDRYGEDRVGQIIAFQTLGARAAIRDVGRALEVPTPLIERALGLLPQRADVALDEAFREVEELRHLVAMEPVARRLFDVATRVEGLKKADSRHAAGIVISPVPLDDVVPVQRAKNGEGLVTQFDDGSIEHVGLLKMDCLGLTNLQTIGRCIDLIETTSGVRIDAERLPEEDAATFDLLARADTVGVFQMEADGARRILMEMKPTSIDDLALATALNRPGPLQNGIVDAYMRRRRGDEPADVPLPALAPVLAQSYGLPVYQEQVMQVAEVVAGYTPGEADVLRAAMGKKDAAKMAAQRAQFVAGATAKGVPKQAADEIFDTIARFAAYGFNASHAVAYAQLAFQTAYLKANHPAEFMVALLNTSPHERYARLAGDAERRGIRVLAPNINTGDAAFSLAPESGDAILFGLGAVKGVSMSAAERFVADRQRQGPIVTVQDLRRRAHACGLSRAMLEALIKAGACDLLGERADLLDRLVAGPAGGATQQPLIPTLFEPDDALRSATVPAASDVQRLAWEREHLGVYCSGHPLAEVRNVLRTQIPHTIAELRDRVDHPVLIAGLVTDVVERVPKSSTTGQRMATVTVEDLTGATRVTFFPRQWAAHCDLVHRDAVIAVRGRVQPDRFAVATAPHVSATETGEDAAVESALQLLADDAFPLDDERVQRATRRRLRLEIEPADISQLAPLRSILRAFRGDVDVDIDVVGTAQVDTVALGDSYRVDPSPPLLELLGELLAPAQIHMEVSLTDTTSDQRASTERVGRRSTSQGVPARERPAPGLLRRGASNVSAAGRTVA